MFGQSVRLGLEVLSDRNAPSTLPGYPDPLIADPNQSNGGIPAYVGLPSGGPTQPSIPDPTPNPDVSSPPTPQAKPDIWDFKALPINNEQDFQVSGWLMCTSGYFGPGKVAMESEMTHFDGITLTADDNGWFSASKPFVNPFSFAGTYYGTPTQDAGNVVGEQQTVFYFRV